MATIVTGHRLCARCQYDLEGLDAAGVCPECALPIADSLSGLMLANADGRYLRRLRTGLSLALNAILLYFICILSIAFAAFMALAAVPLLGALIILGAGIGILVSTVLSLIGYWYYTAPDPMYHGVEPPRNSRELVRYAVLYQFVVSVVTVVFSVLLRTGGTGSTGMRILLQILTYSSWAALILQFFCVMNYTAWLSARIPDVWVAQRARRYRWLIPVVAIVGLPLLFIGPLVALIMYWNLLDRVRKHIRALITHGAPADLPKRLG
ncbi:hypothetical protein BH11PLA1_BH11PLA1_08510 [soil metagenome]